jgi:hypothetical protein
LIHQFLTSANNRRRFGDDFMTSLTDLGFSKGAIAETVVSTYSANGQPNAAPMGVTMENSQRVAFKIYNSALTYRNLRAKRCAVVNVTSDPEVFYRTAFKEANPNGKLPLDWFGKAETVDAPSLRGAEASVEVAVADMKPFDAERARVFCDVKRIQASTVLPKVYCRAVFATIEAVVHATRVKVFLTHPDELKREEALKLLETIRGCRELVNRVAPNSRSAEIMADLTQRAEQWRVQSESLR